MGYFPFFIDIKGKKGLIIGGGRIAEHKLKKILPYEPEITVVATKINDNIRSIEGIKLIEREFVNSDLDDCSFCIAATDDKRFNAYVAGVCRSKHIFINVVDDKDNCGFLFPSVYKAGNLSIGISTQGASPYIAADIKNDILSELPDDIEQILDYLENIRDTVKDKVEDSNKRSVIFREAAKKCMALKRVLSESELEEIINDVVTDSKEHSKGKVIIAGAGCDSYDLITVRALNAIRKAQVLVYDDLIDERILEYAIESCEKIYVGKRNGKHSMPQQEINELLESKAKDGNVVVRLKGGDPYVFGRGGEEMLYLKSKGIEAEEIPGVSSAVAIPAMAGIPVTHREVSRSFSVITGHSAEEDALHKDVKNSAHMDGTCVYLMGLTHLKEITETLISEGKPENTPAAVIKGNFDGTYKAVKGTLADIAQKTQEEGIESPAVIVTGEVVNLDI